MLKNKKIDLKTAVFAILISLGSALRVIFLDQNDLWYDEGYLLITTGYFPIPELDSFIINPPLYYELIKFWTKFFGVSELSLRLPSVIFSSASLLVLFMLAKKMFNKNTALAALLLMAINPFHLWYAQEAATYSIALFLGLLSTYFFYSHFFIRARKKDFIFYTLFTTLALASSHFALVLFTIQALFLIFSYDKSIKEKLQVFTPLVFFTPLSYYFLKGSEFVARGFWLSVPAPRSMLLTLENFILGYNGTTLIYTAADIIVLYLSAILLTEYFKKNAVKKEILLCVSASILPVLLIYLFSKHVFPVYLDRSLLIFTPYLYILLGSAIEKTKPAFLRFGIISSLTLIMAISAARYYNNEIYQPYESAHHIGAFTKKPVKPLTQSLMSRLSPGSLIIFGNNAVIPVILYYSRVPVNAALAVSYFGYDPDIVDVNTKLLFRQLDESLQFPFLKSKDALIKILKNNKRSVLFVGGRFERNGLIDENSQSIKNMLDENLTPVQDLTVDGTRISIYESR